MERIGKPVKITLVGKEWYYQRFYDEKGNESAANLYDSGGDFVKEFRTLSKLLDWAQKKSEREKEARVKRGIRAVEKFDNDKKRALRNEWITKEEKEETQKVFMERIRELIGEGDARSFANRCGMNEGTISGYVNGKRFPTAHAIKRIAIRCGVTTDWLLGKD